MLFFKRTVDIYSKKHGPAGRLSNFTKRSFIFDGIECRSIEGVLQSFKFKSVSEQKIVCGLWGIQAKLSGERADWKETQLLYWNKTEYHRASKEYQELLARLYAAVFEQDEAFRKDLKKIRKCRLIHSIGAPDPENTVLTEKEFISNLKTLCERVNTY